eukprot:scaffold254955_cov25-Tisochrysis_lutea.AAC.2
MLPEEINSTGSLDRFSDFLNAAAAAAASLFLWLLTCQRTHLLHGRHLTSLCPRQKLVKRKVAQRLPPDMLPAGPPPCQGGTAVAYNAVVLLVLLTLCAAAAAACLLAARPDLTKEERDTMIDDLVREVTSLWQTDELRRQKPTPLDGRGRSIMLPCSASELGVGVGACVRCPVSCATPVIHRPALVICRYTALIMGTGF